MTASSMLSHITLLHDKPRSMAYLKSVKQSVRPGDRVLDLGSGSGILGLYAATCGAAHVTCFERDPILVSLIEESAYALGITTKVDVVTGNHVDDLARVADQHDLLVNDPFGFFGLSDELDIMLNFRDRFLEDKTRVVPRQMRLFLVPVRVPELGQWLCPDVHYKDIVSLTLMGQLASQDILTAHIQAKHIVAKPVQLATMDLAEMNVRRVQCQATFEFDTDAEVDFLAGWYEAELAPGIVLRSGPLSNRPMGKSRLFPCGEVLELQSGSKMKVTLDCDSRLGFWSIKIDDDDTIFRTSLQAHPKWGSLGFDVHTDSFRDLVFTAWGGEGCSPHLPMELNTVLQQTRKAFDGSFQ